MKRSQKAGTLSGCCLLLSMALMLLFGNSEPARATSKKYGKCYAKCVQKEGACLEDAAEHGDEDNRTKETTKCENRKKECVDKCQN